MKICKGAAVILLILVVCIIAVHAIIPNPGVVYVRAGTIVGVEYDNDLYIIEDVAGLVWVYGGVEDLSCGDNIAMMMFDRLTPWTIFDDIILTIA